MAVTYVPASVCTGHAVDTARSSHSHCASGTSAIRGVSGAATSAETIAIANKETKKIVVAIATVVLREKP